MFAYLDDIIITSANETIHVEHLKDVFKRLQDHNLAINLNKCIFGEPTITFLGHTVNEHGIMPNPSKVVAIAEYTRPKLVCELKTFIAMINFYRRFIPRALDSQIILLDYLKGNKKNDRSEINWTNEATEAFELCKNQLTDATLLNQIRQQAPLYIK